MTKQARTHLRIASFGPPDEPAIYTTGCGLIGRPSHGATYELAEVDCINCQRTDVYLTELAKQGNGDYPIPTYTVANSTNKIEVFQ